ncbi:pollen-specific leucine-rich repeat extensin-like protein 3 [Iris pallida]|uniref:Pollen-specific leucine-rich repeat extensin-like protein 3 n=1 Tax=Iris pallida TaxID=29817 RepID=A0AAX6H4Y3_IRIPA|nr:pollen-specific leucine-rich repeat extensin-like protein 3 [Iris pallida]
MGATLPASLRLASLRPRTALTEAACREEPTTRTPIFCHTRAEPWPTFSASLAGSLPISAQSWCPPHAGTPTTVESPHRFPEPSSSPPRAAPPHPRSPPCPRTDGAAPPSASAIPAPPGSASSGEPLVGAAPPLSRGKPLSSVRVFRARPSNAGSSPGLLGSPRAVPSPTPLLRAGPTPTSTPPRAHAAAFTPRATAAMSFRRRRTGWIPTPSSEHGAPPPRVRTRHSDYHGCIGIIGFTS